MLPKMPNTRSRHGCDGFYSNGIQHLVVYGGRLMGAATGLSDILVLRMVGSDQKWVGTPGAALSGPFKFITGGLVKRLETDSCDMMFVDSGQTLHTCQGNYSWTDTIIGASYDNLKPYVPMGAANLWPCIME